MRTLAIIALALGLALGATSASANGKLTAPAFQSMKPPRDVGPPEWFNDLPRKENHQRVWRIPHAGQPNTTAIVGRNAVFYGIMPVPDLYFASIPGIDIGVPVCAAPLAAAPAFDCRWKLGGDCLVNANRAELNLIPPVPVRKEFFDEGPPVLTPAPENG